jgi:hypothetical protein
MRGRGSQLIPRDHETVYGSARPTISKRASLGHGAIFFFKNGTDGFKYQAGLAAFKS